MKFWYILLHTFTHISSHMMSPYFCMSVYMNVLVLKNWGKDNVDYEIIKNGDDEVAEEKKKKL